MRHSALLALSAAAVIAASGPVKAKDFWIKAQGSGCQVWSDEAMDNEVITWSGPCQDG